MLEQFIPPAANIQKWGSHLLGSIGRLLNNGNVDNMVLAEPVLPQIMPAIFKTEEPARYIDEKDFVSWQKGLAWPFFQMGGSERNEMGFDLETFDPGKLRMNLIVLASRQLTNGTLAPDLIMQYVGKVDKHIQNRALTFWGEIVPTLVIKPQAEVRQSVVQAATQADYEYWKAKRN